MYRRKFIYQTSAGIAAILISKGVWSGSTISGKWHAYKFSNYTEGSFVVPVTKVTPDDGYYIHTFYDVCPWSRSARYLALTRLPYQGKKPVWGDQAEVCIVDLQEEKIKTVYATKAWSFQLGANVQWGHSDDRFLYTNDIINGQAVCVRIDWESDSITAFAGPKYDIAPDDLSVISPNLSNMNIHQYGYAIPDGPGGKPIPFTKDDMEKEGLWKTDLVKNEKKLLVSLSQFFNATNDGNRYDNSIGYLFHSKFNKQNTRILQVFRAQVNNKGRNASLFSMDTNGNHLTECLNSSHWNQIARLGGSGNHPNWHPDGERVVMNCVPKWLGYQDMLFCSFKYDGSEFTVLSEKHPGSGHPSIHISGNYLLADAYPKQQYVNGKTGTVALRLLNLKTDTEITIGNIPNDVGGGIKQSLPEDIVSGGSQHKLDPHPAWSRNYRQICFNGAPRGKRQVFIADLQNLV